jgi:hypothetical protein
VGADQEQVGQAAGVVGGAARVVQVDGTDAGVELAAQLQDGALQLCFGHECLQLGQPFGWRGGLPVARSSGSVIAVIPSSVLGRFRVPGLGEDVNHLQQQRVCL